MLRGPQRQLDHGRSLLLVAEDGIQIALGEAASVGARLKRPGDLLPSVELCEVDRFCHLAPDAPGAGCGGRQQPLLGAFAEHQERVLLVGAGPWLGLERAGRAFNERFWYAAGGHLFDVVDGEKGDDPACRPNQVFAVSLPYPVLEPGRWKPVLEVVREKLLTPVGLRSLSPDHPDYKPRYDGDLRARDAAYHQGTVWAWLIGPFLDA